MVRRFEHDDAGYLAWLVAHPDGFVLNTYMHVSRGYLVLHRARCRTINRRLPPESRWTEPYAKTCADTRDELDAWFLERAGVPTQPCGICLGGQAGPSSRSREAGRAGPRAPRGGTDPIEMEGEPVVLCIRPMPQYTPDAPPLVIEGAQWLAETFFRRDTSAVGEDSYDAWVRKTQADPTRLNRILEDDINAVNRTMAARTSVKHWKRVLAQGEIGGLRSIDPKWDLIEMPDEHWEALGVSTALAKLFAAIVGPHLKVAVVTKVLHIKRPRLIPVVDSLVLAQIGGRVTDDVATWVAAIEHLRREGRRNLPGLVAVRDHLTDRGIEPRSLGRILEALLWASMPGSILFGQLAQWERVFRPRRTC